MPRARRHLDPRAREQIERGLARVRAEFDVPDGFPDEVVAEAERAAASVDGSALPDRRDVALQTLDPAGSRDLDQAFAISRDGDGHVVHYAIADVAAVVVPGGAIDVEARRRGVTLYLPDRRASLHPPVLSEGRASLLPGQDTLALLWRIALDGDGATTDVAVERAVVCSRAQLTYAQTQRALDSGDADDQVALLAQVGQTRLAREAARGGTSLDLPDQTVVTADGGYALRFDRPRDVERYNAQLSLLTGMEAARLMLEGGVGVVRTLPPADDERIAALRRAADELAAPWPHDVTYPEWLRGIDASSPRGVALRTQAVRTLRGAGYAVVATPMSADDAPDDLRHAAVAAPYAHVTAPLRRLVDRFANQIVLDLSAGREISGWVTEALDDLPAHMARATQRAAAIDRAVDNVVEAVVLRDRVGQVFTAVAVDRRGVDTVVHLLEPAVVAEVADSPDLPLGVTVDVRLTAADPEAGTVAFVPA